MNVPELLTAVVADIRVHGHHKGSAVADPNHFATSPACFAGSTLRVCRDEDEVRFAAYRAVSAYLGQSAIAFNDDPATTPELLCEVLETVALIEAARLQPAVLVERVAVPLRENAVMA